MLTNEELSYLSVWASEEQEPACYGLPAHRMQLANGASGAQLVLLIKAWTEAEGKGITRFWTSPPTCIRTGRGHFRGLSQPGCGSDIRSCGDIRVRDEFVMSRRKEEGGVTRRDEG